MIIIGDAKTELKKLPNQSVNCCVTSPPYFGLRDYGHPGQLGLEPTPGEYVKNMVHVFQEVKRVLKDDGTLWLNLGDSYVSQGGKQVKQTKDHSGSGFEGQNRNSQKGLKTKDLIGIPWRVAFALQADGWYLRQDIIWNKPNPMPESVTDRCTKAHEYIFLLSKSKKYYYDNEAIKEPAVTNDTRRPYAPGQVDKRGNGHDRGGGKERKPRVSAPKGSFNGKTEAMSSTGQNSFRAVTLTRNKRSVWTVTTKPYKGAHFATFPPDLIEPCILAGCPENGIVLDPFFGSGTVGKVAKKNDRDFIGIELNPDYKKLIDERLK